MVDFTALISKFCIINKLFTRTSICWWVSSVPCINYKVVSFEPIEPFEKRANQNEYFSNNPFINIEFYHATGLTQWKGGAAEFKAEYHLSPSHPPSPPPHPLPPLKSVQSDVPDIWADFWACVISCLVPEACVL